MLGNSAWLIAAEGGTRVVSLVSILYLSRTLAAESLGAFQFGLAVFGFLQLVCGGSTEALLTPEVARHPEDVRRLAGIGILISWCQFVVAFALVVAVTWARGTSPEMRSSALILGLAAALVPLSLRFAFLALERARTIGLGTFAGQVTFLGLCVAGVRGSHDVARVAFFWMAGTAVRTTFQLVTFVREHGAIVFETRGLAGWLRRGTWLGTGGVARGLMMHVDVLVLGLFRPAEEVAAYGLAVKLPLFVVSWSALFYMALFPTVARATGDAERVARIEATTIEAVLGVALPGAVCLWLVAEPVMVLLFTQRFRDAAPLLALLVWRIPLVAAAGVFRIGVWARRPQTDARVAVEVLVATVALLLVLAHVAGARGVAAGMLAGDAVTLALYVHASGATSLARVRPAAFVRLGLGVALALGLAYAVPRDAGIVTVAGAIAAWAVGAVVADMPYVRRLGGELGRVRDR